MQRDRQARQARWAVAAMFLANGFVMGAWAPQIPLLMPRHGVTESVLGLLILVLGLGAVSAMLFAGRLISHYGGRRILSLFSLALIPVLPMVVFSGPGSELYRGVGAIVLGGLLLSTVLTLFVVPSAFTLLWRLRGHGDTD